LSRSTPHHENSPAARLARLAVEAYRDVARLGPKDPSVPPIHARYYPYAGLHSTARLREGRILIRLSDLLEDAPDDAVGGLLRVLLARLLRRRIRAGWHEAYRSYTARADVAEASEEARRDRGRKQLGSPLGKVYDLDSLFDSLNKKYFDSGLDRPRLGWSLRDSYRTHGHYDAAHRTIAMSRTLDDARTPDYVVEFILYHEMLHVAMPGELRDGRRRHHTPAFRAAEARYPRMKEAVAWLENFHEPNGTRRRGRRSRKP
jgi:hypothetical protein